MQKDKDASILSLKVYSFALFSDFAIVRMLMKIIIWKNHVEQFNIINLISFFSI